jgi:hypothetical protein
VSENLTVPFTAPLPGVSTQNSYSGLIYIQVSGTGEAWNKTGVSDAFYVFQNPDGSFHNPPFHSPNFPNWVLWINNSDATNYTPLPAYNGSHTYAFCMTAPGGQLSFGVGDNYPQDNSGDYYVYITTDTSQC